MHYDLSFAQKHQLRIISMDRAGHGASSFNPKASIKSFTEDLEELLKHLAIDKFSIAGMSAGAPFALGTAHYLNEMVHKTAIISGFIPYNDESKKQLGKGVNLLLKMAKGFPFILRFMLKMQAKQIKKNPKKAVKQFLKIMSAPDQEVLKNAEVMKIIEEMFTESFAHGHEGVAHEISNVLTQDWGFNLEQINSSIQIWQGDMDNNVPAAWAKILNESLPNSTLKILEGEGHLIIFQHVDEIFGSLAN